MGDVIVGIISFFFVWRYSNMNIFYKNSSDELGPWSVFGWCHFGPFKLFPGFGKFKFIVMNIILLFGLPLMDSISDAFYYGRLESKCFLVHMDSSIVKTMAFFVYLAICKDAVVGFLIYNIYKNEEVIDNSCIMLIKSGEALASFLLEDLVEVALQYFYFEKYSFIEPDVLVYFNAMFMVFKALELTLRMVLCLIENWPNQHKWGRIGNICFLCAIMLINAYPISRAAGAIYQSTRENAIIKGTCLRYDAVKNILIATPFGGGVNCWNAADWIVLISPFCVLLCFFILRISIDMIRKSSGYSAM